MESLTEPIVQLPAALALMAWTAVSVLRFLGYLKNLSNSSGRAAPNPSGTDPGEWRGRLEQLVKNVAHEIERHRQVERELTTVMAEVKGVLRQICRHLEEGEQRAGRHYDQMREVHEIVTRGDS